MAINVNVPGVGNISVEGAASEQTLQSLVNAINGTNTRQQRNAATLGADLKSAGDSAADTSAALKETANSSKQTKAAVAQMAESMSSSMAAVTGQYQVNTNTVGEFAQNLLQTSTQISREWTRAFVSLSRGGLDPISLSANTMKAGIDLASSAVGGMSNLLPAVAGTLAKTFTMLGAAVGKAGIDLLKEQLVASMSVMEKYNKMGVIFTEGLREMRVNTGKTGLSFESFAQVVDANRENIKAFGGTLSDGISKLANVSNAMGESIDSSGKTVRQRLLNLGISIEEQTAIAASYMAQERALQGSRRVKVRDDKEIAELTAKYAVDLKVLQEATGKDAKAIMEKARVESTTAYLMNKLSADQRDSLKGTMAGLSQLPESIQADMKRAVQQVAAGGPITVKSVAQNQEFYDMAMSLGNSITAGTKDMQRNTMKANEQLQKTLVRNAEINEGSGAVLGGIALYADNMDSDQARISRGIDDIVAATNLQEGATDKSYESSKKVMNTTDALQNSVSSMTAESAKITAAFNNISTEALPKVVPAINGLVTGVATAVTTIEKSVTGKVSMTDTLTSLKTGMLSVWNDTAAAIKKSLDEYFGVRRPAAAPGATPSRDTGTLGMTGRLFEVEDFYGKVARGETVLTPKQLENLVSGVSSATMSKAVAQPTLNAPQNSGVDTLGASDSIKQIQNLYSAAMRDITLEKARAEAQKPSDKTSTDIPEEFTNALGKFDIIPLSASIDNLAKQVNTSSTDQQSLLSRQIDKLSELVSAMQDNVRYNERIANELG